MKSINTIEQTYLRGYARALQDMMFGLTGENSEGKRYDPIDFDETHIHSYAFDLKDGGRHHPIADYESIDEIKNIMLQEAIKWIKDDE